MNLLKHTVIDCHIHPAVDLDTDFNIFGSSGDMCNQIQTLRRSGISKACGSILSKKFSPDSFDNVRTLNDKALALRDKFPDFYIPGIHIHPRFPEESCLEIDRCCGRHGARWIGELVGYLMDYGTDYATDDAIQIMRTAVKHDAVVNLHCDNLDVIDHLCRSVPSLKLVLAHPGGDRKSFMARIAKVAEYKNLHMDISGSGIDRYGIIRSAIDIAGKEKVIFGTDYPINNPAVYLCGTLFESLSEDEYSAIFSGNFMRLMRLP